MSISMPSNLILASASPRRKQLLQTSGIPFKIVVANIIEKPHPYENALQYVERNSQEKALAIAHLHSDAQYILSADTIVVTHTGHILEKPINAEDAKSMLRCLSGDTHIVYTGYSIYKKETHILTRVIETKVKFRALSDEEIDAYIVTGEPFDKAGSYGIQGAAMGFVASIDGSYTNVMGLPLSHVLEDLFNHCQIKTFTCTIVS